MTEHACSFSHSTLKPQVRVAALFCADTLRFCGSYRTITCRTPKYTLSCMYSYNTHANLSIAALEFILSEILAKNCTVREIHTGRQIPEYLEAAAL